MTVKEAGLITQTVDVVHAVVGCLGLVIRPDCDLADPGEAKLPACHSALSQSPGVVADWKTVDEDIAFAGMVPAVQADARIARLFHDRFFATAIAELGPRGDADLWDGSVALPQVAGGGVMVV